MDYFSPRFYLHRPLRFLSGNSNYNYLSYITAEDCLDGNITQQIKIIEGDTENVADDISSKTLHLQVTNSVGDSSVLELPALFEERSSYNTEAPALDEYILYVNKGDTVDYLSHVTGIWASGRVKELRSTNYILDENIIVTDSNVDYNTPGMYTVRYQLVYTNKEGLLTRLGAANQIIIVEDQA